MNLKSMLIYEEGRRKKPYKCSEGFWTIGVGHKITDEGVEYYNKSGGLSSYKIDLFLQWDIEKAERAAMKYSWFKDLNEPRQAVIISMIFQMGEAGFADFKKTISFISKGNFQAAATEMLDSKWAKQTLNRAKRHTRQMRTGEWCKEYLNSPT